jgi:hypothetical protein
MKVERMVTLEEAYFHQFGDLTLACMAYNGTDEAIDWLSDAALEPRDDDAAWNASVSVLNARTALRVLVLRMSGGTLWDMGQIVSFISNPHGETLQ